MSRNFARAPRGRPPTFGSAPRLPKPRDVADKTYKEPTKPKSKPMVPKPMNKRKRSPSTSSSDDLTSLESSESGDDASDEGGDESEEESEADQDDLPAVHAPSHSKSSNATGLKSNSLSQDNVSIAGSMDSMFGDFYDEDDDPRLSPEENRKRFENQVFADSDEENDIYQGVDEISDSEDDYSDEHLQEQELLAIISEEDNSEADDLLNHIDGLSAYGFGDESDVSVQRIASPSSESDDDASPERRVHFALDPEHRTFMKHMSQSPTITRALLPSALPDTGLSSTSHKGYGGGDLDDSDLTDDCLPHEAHQNTIRANSSDREPSPSVSPSIKKSTKKQPRRRGPPRGIFIDDGDKPSGILDPSGKIILMTNPHLLGEEFARRYGASQASSPEMGFAEIIEDSDSGEMSGTMMTGASTDIMLASLNSARNHHLNRGQAVGPLEAFYPSNVIRFGDYAIDPDDLEGDYIPDDDLGEDVINLEDVIQFDEDSDVSDSPTSPIFLPPNRQLSDVGNSNGLSHLNNNNVTAFRRNADPAFAAFSNTPMYQDADLLTSPYTTPAPRRKRKHFSSPYTSSHYKGVTPVQRMRDPGPGAPPSTPDTATPAKRRKVMI